MSKTAQKSAHKKSNRDRPAPKSRDRAIYLGLLIIGLAVIAFVFLVFEGRWREVTLGYIIAMAWLTNLYAFAAYRGKSLANWQQALARIPLRFAGYGSRDGKPLSAAKDSDHARRTIFVSVAVSAAIVVIASFLLIPALL